MNNLEFDHADIFDDLEVIKEAFARFVRLVPDDGAIFAFYDDPVVRNISRNARCEVVSYGTTAVCHWQVDSFCAHGLTSMFDLYHHGVLFGAFQLAHGGDEECS